VPEEGGISSPPSRNEHSKVTQCDIDSVSVELLHEVLPFAWVSRLHGTEQFQLTHSDDTDECASHMIVSSNRGV